MSWLVWCVVCWVTVLNGSVLLCLAPTRWHLTLLAPCAGRVFPGRNERDAHPSLCFPLRVQSSTADGPRALISAGTFPLPLWRGRGRGAWGLCDGRAICANGEKKAYLTETWKHDLDHTVTEYS